MKICPDCYTLVPEKAPVSCKECGWKSQIVEGIDSYLSSDDRSDAIVQDYVANYDEIASDDLAQAILDERYISQQVDKMLGYVKGVAGAKVCDVGVGKGYLARGLLAAGAESVTAVDITTQYLKLLLAEANIKPVLANAENLPFKEEFDIITSTDVLEHVLNVGSFLLSVHESLKPGGVLYLRVPYRESLLNYSPRRGCKYKFVHLRNFNKKLLSDMMSDVGFQIVGFNLDGFSIYTPRNYVLNYPLFLKFYNLWQVRMLAKLEHHSDVGKWKNWIAGLLMRPQEVVVIARKKL